MADLKAFQEFMLQGKGAGPAPCPSTPNVKRSSHQYHSSSGKKHAKIEVVVIRAFQARLQEWKDLDEQVGSVLGSVANLRDRVWWESRQTKTQLSRKPWDATSFRPLCATALTLDDVEKALMQDLLHHEKMLATSRTLMATMAQTQDAMGRRLDEWMMMELECSLTDQGRDHLENAQILYGILAEELFRKQELLQTVLHSCGDGLLEKDATAVMSSPRTVARKAYEGWRAKDAQMLGLLSNFLME